MTSLSRRDRHHNASYTFNTKKRAIDSGRQWEHQQVNRPSPWWIL